MEYETFYEEYKKFDVDTLISFLFLKERQNETQRRQIDSRNEVIELIAEYIGIADKGLCIYEIYEDGTTPILDKLIQFIDKSGDKVKLKKRIDELVNENNILRTLITK